MNSQNDDVDRIVEQWSRERPELQTEAMAVFGRIYRIAKLVGDGQEQVYAQHGISRSDFDVLATLRRNGAPHQLSPTALAASMMLTTGAMTGRLDRLEKRGLIKRTPDPNDRRGLVITLTDPGRTLIDEAVGPGLAAQRAVLEQLSPARQRQLTGLLRELLAAAQTPDRRGTAPAPHV